MGENRETIKDEPGSVAVAPAEGYEELGRITFSLTLRPVVAHPGPSSGERIFFFTFLERTRVKMRAHTHPFSTYTYTQRLKH